MVTQGAVPDNVIELSSRRKRDFVVTVDKVADSLNSPFHCLASDGKKYWCKQVSGSSGETEVVNEVVASQIGRRLGAPMRPWKILDIPLDLVHSWAGNDSVNRYRIKSEPVFASEEVHDAVHSYFVEELSKDGNYERFPLLISTWLLCNAQDVQLLYDANADMSVWSVDHGFWFGSQDIPWNLAGPDRRAGIPNMPSPHGEIPAKHWNAAKRAVESLDASVLDDVTSTIPEEWPVSPEKCAELVNYAVGRKNYTLARLDELQQASTRR
jgi:hypothetical protein